MTKAQRRAAKRARDLARARRLYVAVAKVHIGPIDPICGARGPRIIGPAPTCRRCLALDKARKVGSSLNEWEAKRVAQLALEISREKKRKWRAANLDKARAAARRWRENNRDLRRINGREWRAKNAERVKANWRSWAARNPGWWRRPKTEERV